MSDWKWFAFLGDFILPFNLSIFHFSCQMLGVKLKNYLFFFSIKISGKKSKHTSSAVSLPLKSLDLA